MYVPYFVFLGGGGGGRGYNPLGSLRPPPPLRRWAQKLHTYGRIGITRDMYIRAAGLESGGGDVVFFDEKIETVADGEFGINKPQMDLWPLVFVD